MSVFIVRTQPPPLFKGGYGDKGFENHIKRGRGGDKNFKYKGGSWPKRGGLIIKGEIDVYFVIFLKELCTCISFQCFNIFS